jgi:hypothetical protein
VSMRGDRRKRREQHAELEGRMAEALADVTCDSCGGVYEGSAYQVHREDLGRGRVECLPGDARGQLVKLGGGRWGQRWRHPEISS